MTMMMQIYKFKNQMTTSTTAPFTYLTDSE